MALINGVDLYKPATITVVIALLYLYVLYPAVLSPLRKIPNAHWSCPYSSLWILRARFESRENRTLHAAHQEHGPIIRLGPNELSINSVDGVKTIYQGGFDKHQWYSLFNNYGVPCMFSSVEARHHSPRKRMVSNVYSKSYINGSASVEAQADVIINSRLIPLLEKSLSDDQNPHGVNVHSLFCAAAMDFISAYCFGIRRSANFIQNKAEREHWLTLYTTRKGYGFFAQELPGFSKALGYLGVRLTPSWVDAANQELESWCRKLSDKTVEDLRKAESSTTPNAADDPVVVRALLAGIEKEEKTNGSESPIYPTALLQPDLSVASEIFDHLLAGQETTGVALTYLSHHLSQSLELQRELRAELLSLSPNMKLQQGNRVNLPDSKQLDNLPTLHAMIVETVRRYAPAGGPEPRITPAASCRIEPYEVPGGVRVSASPYCLHRDERAFPDPEKWDHKRWLQAQLDDEHQRRDIDKQFWGFSSGGRMCLGSNFAMHDMKIVIAAVYSNYTSYIVDDKGIEQTDAYTGHPRSNSLYLRFERVVLPR